MAAPVKPALSRSFGTESWWWVPAVADVNAPKVAEVTAATGIRLDGYVFGDQAGVTGSTEKVTLPRRMMETQQFEVTGTTTYSAADFTVSFDPQGTTGSDGKKAWETMTDHATGFLIQRNGVDPATDATAGQFVNVYPAQLGVKTPIKTATDATGVNAFTVGVSITDTPGINATVAA